MLGSQSRGHQRSTPLNRESAPRAQEGLDAALSRSAEPSEETQSRINALEELILARLDDDKAQDVVFIDLKGKSAMADGRYFCRPAMCEKKSCEGVPSGLEKMFLRVFLSTTL